MVPLPAVDLVTCRYQYVSHGVQRSIGDFTFNGRAKIQCRHRSLPTLACTVYRALGTSLHLSVLESIARVMMLYARDLPKAGLSWYACRATHPLAWLAIGRYLRMTTME